ncbi:MAG: hypothetical protein ACFNYI_06050 [Eubacterium sp.]
MKKRALSAPLKTFCLLLALLLAAAFMPALAPKASAASKKSVTSYQQAVKQYYKKYGKESRYRLIDLDGQGSKELICDVPGYYVTLYTKTNGKVHRLMNTWSYGAGGNGGYFYRPGKNQLGWYVWNDTDHDEFFMKVNAAHTKIITTGSEKFSTSSGPVFEQKGSGYKRIVGKYKKNQILKQLKK